MKRVVVNPYKKSLLTSSSTSSSRKRPRREERIPFNRVNHPFNATSTVSPTNRSTPTIGPTPSPTPIASNIHTRAKNATRSNANPKNSTKSSTNASAASALIISASDKAGMQGIDRARIDEIILRTSGNSLFMQQQRRRDEKVNEKIRLLQERMKNASEKEYGITPMLETFSLHCVNGANMSHEPKAESFRRKYVNG